MDGELYEEPVVTVVLVVVLVGGGMDWWSVAGRGGGCGCGLEWEDRTARMDAMEGGFAGS